MTNDTNIDFARDDLDTRHDPDPMRFYPIEFQRREAAETARQRALIAAWATVPEPLRGRAIKRWFARNRPTVSVG
jgi:hypothetical protein